jgi:NAD(P)H-hydrate epimerase
MLKILSGSDCAALDRLHMEKEGISSLEFMERVAQQVVDWYMRSAYPKEGRIAVCCGAGNNGGDGFAIARLLHQNGYRVAVIPCFSAGTRLSADAEANFRALPAQVPQWAWDSVSPDSSQVWIDAFLGVGWKGPLREEAKQMISRINACQGVKIAIDLPSGLPTDTSIAENGVQAEVTLTLGFPKRSLLFPEHAKFTGELVLLDIGIKESELDAFASSTYYLQAKDILAHHRVFDRFSHKRTRGKVLLLAGSKGKVGAAILSSKSALRTGSGLVTCCLPEEERGAIQAAVPEVMCTFGEDQPWSTYDAIGLGPGMQVERCVLLEQVFTSYSKPLVLDADALTYLALHKELWALIPKGSILTPHLGEFERLFGPCSTHVARMSKASEFCQRYGVHVLIKGAHSLCCFADGRQVFNSSGSKFMATAGCGDVLTGMLTSYLGQGYSPEDALLCGVFHHGRAGELAGKKKLRGMLASDLLEEIPNTYLELGLN